MLRRTRAWREYLKLSEDLKRIDVTVQPPPYHAWSKSPREVKEFIKRLIRELKAVYDVAKL